MNDYTLYDENTAPQEARQTLQQTKGKYGFIPNLMGTMVESPALVKADGMISKLFEETSFTTTEKQVMLLAVSHENECDYCSAAHSTVARMSKVPDAINEAMQQRWRSRPFSMPVTLAVKSSM